MGIVVAGLVMVGIVGIAGLEDTVANLLRKG